MIEKARNDDIEALCDLLHSLFAQEEEFEPNRNAQRTALSQILQHPDKGVILVSRDNDSTPVGMVSLLFMPSTALGGNVVLLEDMVVASSQQGKGIGSALLQAAIQYAESNNFLRITLLTDASNHGAQRFYEKHRFKKSSMTVMRRSPFHERPA